MSERYRKKPVVIEAMQFNGAYDSIELERWVGDAFVWDNPQGGKVRPFIVTLEGDMAVNPGDWIIKGVKGEFYPVKPDIFDATYELVE